MVKKRKKTKKLKKKEKHKGIFVDNEWGDFFIFGLFFVAMIKFGYPYFRSVFGIE